MVNKHCCYGTCNSDSRYKDRPHMEGVEFVYFPQPNVDYSKCERWVKACGRPCVGKHAFVVENVNRNTYICTKHFVGGKGPTVDHPDPIPAAVSNVDLAPFKRRKQRKPLFRWDDTSVLDATSATAKDEHCGQLVLKTDMYSGKDFNKNVHNIVSQALRRAIERTGQPYLEDLVVREICRETGLSRSQVKMMCVNWRRRTLPRLAEEQNYVIYKYPTNGTYFCEQINTEQITNNFPPELLEAAVIMSEMLSARWQNMESDKIKALLLPIPTPSPSQSQGSGGSTVN